MVTRSPNKPRQQVTVVIAPSLRLHALGLKAWVIHKRVCATELQGTILSIREHGYGQSWCKTANSVGERRAKGRG
eukprot:2308548-Alexandrium_andersonii.AAC.1